MSITLNSSLRTICLREERCKQEGLLFMHMKNFGKMKVDFWQNEGGGS